jgi:hypothetical protein
MDNGLNSIGHLAEIHRRQVNTREAKFPGIFHQMVNMGCPDQGFARDATVVKAIASKLLLFFD